MCEVAEAVAAELWAMVGVAAGEFVPERLPDRNLAFIRQKMCGGKHAFDDKWTARRVAKRAMAVGFGHTRPFRCGFCGRWHLGGRHGHGLAYYERMAADVEATLTKGTQ